MAMKTATVAELHEHLDEYLDAVRNGERVEIRDDEGRIAQIVPTTSQRKLPAAYEKLIAAGVASRPENYQPLPDDFFERPRGTFASGSLLEALLEEREEGW